jgi:hypothetical protein
MNDDRALRAADPAADLPADAGSAPARAMLAAILDTPTDSAVTRRPAGPGRRIRPRRVVLAGAVAATAGVLAPALWHSGPIGATAAYAVSVKADGSVHVTIRGDQIQDPVGLAAALRKAGVPTVVRTGAPTSNCGTPGEQKQAQEALLDDLQYHSTGLVMWPNLFPAHSTIVVTSFDTADEYGPGKLHDVRMYLAHTKTPSCAIGSTAVVWESKPAD